MPMYGMSRSPPTKHGWTDELCLEEGRKYCQWKEIPVTEMKGHMMRFVNMWFCADRNDYSVICSTVRNVLLMFPLGLSNELLLRDVFDSAIDTAQTPSAVDEGTLIKEPLVDDLDDEEKADVLAFHNWINQHFALLKRAEMKPPNGQHCSQYNHISQKLRTVLGFCALLLMRMITKNEVQIKRYFPYGASKAFDLLFHALGLNVSLVPPAAKFLKVAKYALSNNGCNRKSVEVLHLLVFQYLKSTAKVDASSRFTKQILEEGCLNVLEGNGMGLVTMFQEVKQLYNNIEERSLLSMIAEGSRFNQISKKLLINFLDIYARKDKPQYSWKWARVLSQNYFSDLNIRENRELCCRFAALLVDKNPGIFGHKQLSPGIANIAIAWAEPTKKVLKQLNDRNQPGS